MNIIITFLYTPACGLEEQFAFPLSNTQFLLYFITFHEILKILPFQECIRCSCDCELYILKT